MNDLSGDIGTTTGSAIQNWEVQLANSPITTVPIRALLPANSPRLRGENREHVRLLAEADVTLPPISVHRATMRVIDGMHRLHAALWRSDEGIEVRFFDGDERDAFALAVHANVAHGLPLTLIERKRAAIRIVRSHPQWSDRLVAWTTGLSHKTVGLLRQRVTGDNSQSHMRVGHDGRARPLSTAGGRRLAGDLLRRNPRASLREVAKAAGISTATVRDVRIRLSRGEDPVPPVRRSTQRRPGSARTLQEPTPILDLPTQDAGLGRGRPAAKTATPTVGLPADSVMRTLRNDPALRFTDAGRALLRWLDTGAAGVRECAQLVEKLPSHCVIAIARVAHANASVWDDFATQLELRVQPIGQGSHPAQR